jgi:hypothetical protein
MASPASSRVASRPRAAAVGAVLALACAGCGTSVSTTSFKGEEHEVAQTVANLQSDVTAGEQGKLCTRDLAAALVQRLGGRTACEAGVKEQLAEIDNLETTVQSVTIAHDKRTATAVVKSVYSGKSRRVTLRLIKEPGGWRVAGLQ